MYIQSASPPKSATHVSHGSMDASMASVRAHSLPSVPNNGPGTPSTRLSIDTSDNNSRINSKHHSDDGDNGDSGNGSSVDQSMTDANENSPGGGVSGSSSSQDPPRKRSKVSRACDACRRKKIRCNAEFSSTLQKVTKICDNCVKNNENCTFSRVPLKRGPSKGYIRDLEEKLDTRQENGPNGPNGMNHSVILGMGGMNGSGLVGVQSNSMPQTPISMSSGIPSGMNSMNSSNSNNNNGTSTISSIPIPHHQPLPFPQGHLKAPNHSPNIGSLGSNMSSGSPPIVLPPLVGYQSKILPTTMQKLSTSASNKNHNTSITISGTSNPSSPRSATSNSINGILNSNSSNSLSTLTTNNPNNANSNATTASANTTANNNSISDELIAKNTSPPIQGPFWKVPYEMPTTSSRRSSISLNNVPNSSVLSGSSSVNGSIVGSSSIRRRSSIDSISSTSTNGSRFPSLKPSVSVSSDLVSDSDPEEFYSMKSTASSTLSLAGPPHHNRSSSINNNNNLNTNHIIRSRRNSQSLSPRNSVTSLSSLSGRINKSLHFQATSNNSSASVSLIPSPIPSQAQQPQQPQFAPTYPFGAPMLPQHLQPGGIVHPQPQPFQQLQQPHFAPGVPQYQFAHPQQPQFAPQQALFQPIGSFAKINSLEENLQAYYSKFHASFPILPFNQNYLIGLLENSGYEEAANNKVIVDMFNVALNNLNNFKKLSISDHTAILSRLLSLYPFTSVGIAINDASLVFYFSALILVNYAVLLNGDVYSLGISLTASVFNDFKVLENFIDLVDSSKEQQRPLDLDYDNIKVYLPKLYYALNVIDNLYCLSFGMQKALNHSELAQFLGSHMDWFLPLKDEKLSNSPLKSGLLVLQTSTTLNELVRVRVQSIVKARTGKDKVTPVTPASISKLSNYSLSSNTDDFTTHFITLVTDKLELTSYLSEIEQYMSSAHPSDVDDVFENLMDYNLKLVRLVKKLSNSIITFANYISTTSSSATNSPDHTPAIGGPDNKNNGTNGSNNGSNGSNDSPNGNSQTFLINPLLNIAIGQLFKLIKLNKMLVDSLITLVQSSQNARSSSNGADHGHGEVLNRCVKINNDLSISFNLLNLNLVNLQLGSISTNLIRTKIVGYKFNFNLQSLLNASSSNNNNGITTNGASSGGDSGNLNKCLQTWSAEFSNSIIPFVEKENIDGWY
ncbi:uncharacterized protein RJT20DRAFT_129506 [Scheffersomyces xylosifermentans]|uniref:uncharacterized protein n=1 Tax=Scheffersomyces xylosifermentans TaxID=1304137 RepID=UPI00315DFDC0